MHSLRYDANLSMLFTELNLFERPDAARAAGFEAAEFWWPFDMAVPADAEVERFVRVVANSGLTLVGLNFFAGDMPGGDRGLVSWIGRESEFADNVAVTVDIARRLGCGALNALYGNRLDGVDPAAQDELAVSNVELAATRAAGIGARVLIEPVSGAPRYPLRTAADAVRVLDRVPGRDNVALLADLYHLSVNGDDVPAVLARHADRIGHVQIADAPGRNEPGSGELDLDGWLTVLQDAGYHGYVGLEYKPSTDTLASLEWLPPPHRTAPEPHQKH